MKLWHKRPKETPASKLLRSYEEWYVHAIGLARYHTVQEMIDEGWLSLPVYKTTPTNKGE